MLLGWSLISLEEGREEEEEGGKEQMPREVVDAPFLATLKVRWDWALSKLIKLMSLLT